MENLMAFLSSFASYGLVFFIFIAAIVTGVAIGVTARTILNNKKLKKEVKNLEE